ncbi:MAG: extracellular solute-binding protein [Christensenellales bacterium]|jgi:putative aldouronate transport system substrate-binding protein
MNRWTRMIAMAIALIMLAGIAAACTPSTGGAGGGQAKDLVEITAWVWDRGSIPESEGTLEDNWWTQYVNEKMAEYGIKVSYVIDPAASRDEAISTKLAAGTAPDLVRTTNFTVMNTYINNGGVADITQYVEKHNDNLKNFYEGDSYEWGIRDGKVYGFYHYDNGLVPTTWVRNDLLKELNMELPTNMDEFYDMLVAAKEAYPELGTFALQGNQYTHWRMVILPAFTEETPEPIDFWKPALLWDGAKEALRYLNKLYNEGFIKSYVLDSGEAQFREDISRGNLFSFIGAGHYPFHSAYGLLYDNLRANHPDAELLPSYPFKNSSGTSQEYFYMQDNPLDQYMFFVPASSKHQEEAVIFLNWLASDEAYLTGNLGVEGTEWEYDENGIPKYLYDTAVQKVAWIEPQYGTMGKVFAGNPEKFLLNYIKDFNSDYHQQIKDYQFVVQDMPLLCPPMKGATPVYDDKKPTLNAIERDQVVQLIEGSVSDFDAKWDAVYAEYLAAGALEAWEDLQNTYNANK